MIESVGKRDSVALVDRERVGKRDAEGSNRVQRESVGKSRRGALAAPLGQRFT